MLYDYANKGSSIGLSLSTTPFLNKNGADLVGKITKQLLKTFTCILASIALVFSATAALAEQPLKDVYRYCVDPDWMPYEAIINGEHKGISSEYKALFERYSGLTFEFLPTSSWEQSIEFIRSGKCDLNLMLNSSAKREEYMAFTMPYFFGPNILVTKAGDTIIHNLASIGNLRLGVVTGYRIGDYIDKYHPHINKIDVESEIDGLNALREERIDVYIGSSLSITAKLKQLGYTDLKINSWTSVQDELRIGVGKQHAETLIPVLNRAIEKIPVAVHNDIFHRWSNILIVKEPDYTLLWRATGIGSIILLLVAALYWHSARNARAFQKKNDELHELHQQLEESNKKLEHLSYHDNLTGLYNRHYFLTTFKHVFEDTQRQEHKAALMMLDLDHFKQINDQYGHNVGDDVLRKFGQILTSMLRSGDIAARWGGEEFLVLMPSTGEAEMLFVAERIKKRIETTEFAVVGHITASIGLSEFVSGDSMQSWLERTDKALYEAKSSRNTVKVLRN
jgi:diguanylate cyclase (GGDEF)-like protein